MIRTSNKHKKTNIHDKDLRLTGKVNHFCNYVEEHMALKCQLWEIQQAVNDLMKKALENDQALGESKTCLEMANVHHEIHNHFHLTFGGGP